MAKTIANLTNEEMMIITDYVELFGITEEEALSQAISEGSISDSVGGNFKYKPEGFNELKFYKVDPKSAMYKLNKELKKNKKDAPEYIPYIFLHHSINVLRYLKNIQDRFHTHKHNNVHHDRHDSNKGK